MVDTGSDVSLVPYKGVHSEIDDSQCVSVTGNQLRTYGKKRMKIDIGTEEHIEHEFIKADIRIGILGSDFLFRNNIIVDVGQKLLYKRHKQNIATIETENNDVDKNVNRLLHKYKNLTTNLGKLPKTNKNFIHTIKVIGPIQTCKVRRTSPVLKEILKKRINEFLDRGILRPSNSAWGSAVMLTPKKGKPIEESRLVIDFRNVNKVIQKDSYPPETLQDFVNNLHDKVIFSTLDMKDAYYSVSIREEDKPITAIRTPIGSFEFNRLPQGLSTSPAAYVRFMAHVLRNLKRPGTDKEICTFCYVDDILIASESYESHIKDLEVVFERLNDFGLKLSVKKCQLAKEKIKFLGHDITKDGFKAEESRVQAIKDYGEPQTYGALKKFLGMIQFYSKFIEKCADIISPLFDILKGYKKTKRYNRINWETNPEAKQAFALAKKAITKETMLTYPSEADKMILAVDASNRAVGGVLYIEKNKKKAPLGFFSKKLSDKEKLSTTFRKELTAVYLGIKHFRYLLEYADFTLLTDHKPIIGAIYGKDKEERGIKETRMLAFISEFNVTIKHTTGSDNIIADTMSREIYNIEQKQYSLGNKFIEEIRKLQHPCEEINKYKIGTDRVIKLEKVGNIWCERIKNINRVFVPKSLRYTAFKNTHEIAHMGIKFTIKQMTRLYVWPNIKRDITIWTRACFECQRQKIFKHNVPNIESFKNNESEKNLSWNIDVVGPLPEIDNFKYILTIVDRFSRFVDAYPMENQTAKTVSTIIYYHISQRGLPKTIISDNGTNFTSSIFKRMLETLGIDHVKTLAYTPRTNGLVENIHRSLKQSLRSSKENWVLSLASWKLIKNTTVREDMGCSPYEVMFGASCRVPFEVFNEDKLLDIDHASYVDKIQTSIAEVKPKRRVVAVEGKVDKNLWQCKKVFVRNMNKKGLSEVYKGPYTVTNRDKTYFEIDINGIRKKIKIDRLKTAYILEKEQELSNEPDEDEGDYNDTYIEARNKEDNVTHSNGSDERYIYVEATNNNDNISTELANGNNNNNIDTEAINENSNNDAQVDNSTDTGQTNADENSGEEQITIETWDENNLRRSKRVRKPNSKYQYNATY